MAVAEEAHFGRAAQRLRMAQPPLSQQIRALEAEMGVVLFHRTTRKVELTAAGERFLVRARAILAEVDDAVAEAADVADGMLGRIAIGFTGSATYDLLPSLVRVLRADLPGIELDIHGEMLTPDQVTALADGSLDLGLLRPPVHSTAIDVQVLRRELLIAVLPEHHGLAGRDRVQLSDLRDDPFISYPSQHRSVVYEAVMDACQRAASSRPPGTRWRKPRRWSHSWPRAWGWPGARVRAAPADHRRDVPAAGRDGPRGRAGPGHPVRRDLPARGPGPGPGRSAHQRPAQSGRLGRRES